MPLTAELPSESAEQQRVVRWWMVACTGYNVPEQVLMASAGQAKRTVRNASRMKAEGYRAGTPDLFLAMARGGKHGLFIEMKRQDGGTLAETQKEMNVTLAEQNYTCVVAHGADQAKAAIVEYLAL